MKLARWMAFGLAALLLAGGAQACIEALTLDEMVARVDTCVHGTITQVESVAYTPPGDDRLIYTILTVEGEDLYTGKARTVKAAFLGGHYQGDSMLVTSMPAPGEYRVGNEIVAFSAPIENGDWGPSVDRSLYTSMGGIYPVHKNVVFGKGEGFAIDENRTLTDLREGISRALVAKQNGRTK
jgi:hypothetical protein